MTLSFDKLVEKTTVSLTKTQGGCNALSDLTNGLNTPFHTVIRAVLDALEMDVDEKGIVFTRYTVTKEPHQQNVRSRYRARGKR